jgi:hypothetical protein
MTDENTNEEKSFVYVEFEEIGSAEVTSWNFNNVSPLQLLALSSLLEFEGKSALAIQRSAQVQAQREREQMTQIAVPKPSIEIGKK